MIVHGDIASLAPELKAAHDRFIEWLDKSFDRSGYTGDREITYIGTNKKRYPGQKSEVFESVDFPNTLIFMIFSSSEPIGANYLLKVDPKTKKGVLMRLENDLNPLILA